MSKKMSKKKRINPNEYGDNARQFLEITTKSLQEIMSQFIKDIYETTSMKLYLTYSLKFNTQQLHDLDNRNSELFIPNIKNYKRQMLLPAPKIDDYGLKEKHNFNYELWNRLIS